MEVFNSFQEVLASQSGMDGNTGNFDALRNMSPQFKAIPRFKGRSFAPYGNEIQYGELEPAHVHIQLQEGKPAFWLVDPATNRPGVSVKDGGGIPPHILNDVVKHLEGNLPAAIQDWNHFVDENYPEFVNRKVT